MKKLILLLFALSCAAVVFGQTKSEVVRSQKALKHLGLYAGQADGIAGPKTSAAVRQYQEQNALPSTGKLDSVTVAALVKIELPKTATQPDTIVSLYQVPGATTVSM